MKNTSLIINIVLAIAVAVLYYLHFSCSSSCAPINTDEVAVENDIKIESPSIAKKGFANVGYINIDSLQDKYDLYEVLIQKLKSKQTKYESEISGKMVAFEKKVKDFQQKASTMTQFEGQMKQQELAEEEQKLYKLREDFAGKFQEEEAKLNDEFQKTVQAYIQKHNKTTNYDIIIGASQLGNIVLDFKPEIDITQNVVDGLNAEYKAKSTK
ncbi:MAG: OmpH family outer membrane protein [Flavobacteriales bacterium]